MTQTAANGAHDARELKRAGRRALLRSSLVMHVLTTLLIAPIALGLSGFLNDVSPWDLRNGAAVVDLIAEPAFDAFVLVSGLGVALVALALALPLRLAWLSALQTGASASLWSHLRIGLRRTPRALGGALVLAALALIPLSLAALLPFLPNDTINPRVEMWTRLALCLPLLLLLGLTLCSLDLFSAAALDRGAMDSVRFALRKSARALPAYVVFLATTSALTWAGYAISAPPLVLLIVLQSIAFTRFCVRGLWLRRCLAWVTPAPI